jgi:hypothetical protein
MPRPRTLDAHPREFFALTEELLTTPTRTVDCGGPGPRGAFALRAGAYHFWSRLRREVEESGLRPDKLDELARRLSAAGKLPDSADGTLMRALYRVASNTSIGRPYPDGAVFKMTFFPKSHTSLAAMLAENLARPDEPAGDDGSELLRQIEQTKLD